MKKIIAIFSATIELIASLLSPQAATVSASEAASASPIPQAAAEVCEEPSSFTEAITVISPLPEEEVPEPSSTLSPAPQDENGNYIGPGTATTVVSFTIE